MLDALSFLLVLALLGGGLVIGAQFAYTTAVLQTAADLEPEQAMFVMRHINDRFESAPYLVIYFGTLVAVCAIAAVGLLSFESVERWWLIAGTTLYGLGPFGITLLHNSPLNRQLKAADWSNAERVWPAFRRRAQFWSPIRTVLGILALGALAVGAVEF